MSNQIEFAMALGEYLIQLATMTGTDRFHCSGVIPANPFYKPEHDWKVQKAWSQFAFGERVAEYFPEYITYDKSSGWFTVKAAVGRLVGPHING